MNTHMYIIRIVVGAYILFMPSHIWCMGKYLKSQQQKSQQNKSTEYQLTAALQKTVKTRVATPRPPVSSYKKRGSYTNTTLVLISGKKKKPFFVGQLSTVPKTLSDKLELPLPSPTTTTSSVTSESSISSLSSSDNSPQLSSSTPSPKDESELDSQPKLPRRVSRSPELSRSREVSVGSAKEAREHNPLPQASGQMRDDRDGSPTSQIKVVYVDPISEEVQSLLSHTLELVQEERHEQKTPQEEYLKPIDVETLPDDQVWITPSYIAQLDEDWQKAIQIYAAHVKKSAEASVPKIAGAGDAWTPLMYAAANGDIEAIKKMKFTFKDVKERHGKPGELETHALTLAQEGYNKRIPGCRKILKLFARMGE